jgi:SSS family solute:Na+ symporter
MSLNGLDWSIVAGLVLVTTGIAVYASRQTRSVADFLVANRCAGRYMLCIADGIAAVGVISILGTWEMVYESGWNSAWWGNMLAPLGLLITLSGFIIYRFRQTRALTLAQFFEVRYGRSFRILSGLLSYMSGIFSIGIYPAVGSKFFVYFCGMPTAFSIQGLVIPTFIPLMLLLVVLSLSYTWIGGQITIMVTDFVQGFFCSLVFLIGLIWVITIVDWTQIFEALSLVPEGKSRIHPFKGGELENFNMWYWIIAGFGAAYSYMSWQGSQAYNSAAKNAHEAKMAKIVGSFRGWTMSQMLMVLPIIAFTMLTHSSHSDFAAGITKVLDTISNDSVRDQMTVPVFLSAFLPVGLKGAFCAVMVAAFVSTHNTLLHSWGSIFIQDVVMPFRKKPFEAGLHMRLLKISILGVAVIICLYSILYRQTQPIFMYFANVGAIFAGGAGAAIIGGLYWKKGNAAGAWAAMLASATIAISTMVCRQIWPSYYGHDFPINSQYMWAIIMAVCTILYVVFSLIINKDANMDRLLHRGKYNIEKDGSRDEEPDFASLSLKERFLNFLGWTHEFTRGDKAIYVAGFIWGMGWFVLFLVGTVYNIFVDVSDSTWFAYWKVTVWIGLVLGSVTTVWLGLGGLRDMKDLFHRLRTAKRDDRDDGMVINHHNRDEIELDEPANLGGDIKENRP